MILSFENKVLRRILGGGIKWVMQESEIFLSCSHLTKRRIVKDTPEYEIQERRCRRRPKKVRKEYWRFYKVIVQDR